MDEFLSEKTAAIALGYLTDHALVLQVATRYINHEMSAEVALAEIMAILGKENN